MIAGGVIPEQARLMQGDLYALIHEESNAIDSYSKLLESPQYAKAAAERIIPLLERHGRAKEAEYLAKRFGKGCC